MSTLNDYEILDKIGSGTYGDVFKARFKRQNKSSEIFAIKKIDFTKANTKELEHLSREESILRNLCNTKHENIVRYVTSFKTDSVLYIVTELCAGGSLYDYLRQVKIGLEEHEFKTYLEQILNGVKYLHSKNITHRDLKTKNILLSSDCRIKIADFGVAKEVTSNRATNTVYVGTMHYIAPEMTDGKGNYNSKIDIWAIGCDCYEMGTSKYAFDGRNVTELKNAVGKNMLPNINSLRFCETMREMIIQMLALDPTKRPDAATLHEEVLRHDCQNMKQCQKSHKQTQVFSHSTAIPGQQRNEVFLSSQSSNISTIQRCPDHDREPTQNTDSFEKQNGEDSSCLSPRPYSKGLKLTVSGEQNTDSYEFNKPRSVSTSSLGDSIKSTSSSRIDSSSDIPNLYQTSVDKFDKLLYNTLMNEGGRDVYRNLGNLMLKENWQTEDFERLDQVLGERFAWLRTLVLTVKNLEDGVKEYSNR